MATKTEGKHTGEFLVSEAPGTLSRDEATVTVPASTTLAAGTVLGQVAADGTYAAYDNADSDGSETAAGVLYDELVNAGEAAVDVAATVINLNAEVRSADLVWKDGLSAGDKTAGLADLRALGIKAR